MPPLRRLLLPCSLTLVLGGCDLLGGGADGDDDKGAAKPANGAESGDGSGGDASLLAEPLVRAKKRLRFIGKASEHLGWKLTSLSKMYALAGAVEVPQWSPEGTGQIRWVRNDDLSTAWTCEQTRDKPCAFGIHFPQPATVVAIRINASPSGAEDPSLFGRIKTLRVHTDEGWAEDNVLVGYENLYLQLGEPVVTRNLTVEVIDAQSKTALLRVADFDVYGTEGEPRSPIAIDPATAFLQVDSPTWKKTVGGERALQGSRLMYSGANDEPKMLALGSAAFANGDRMLLIEQLTETKCKSHLGGYEMLDLKTRVRVPLGDMGGMPGDVWMHAKGRGFAVGYVDEDNARVHAFVIDEDTYQRKKSSRASRDTYHELFEQWGVLETPANRGGGTVEDPPAGCQAASPEDYARMDAARSGGSAPVPVEDAPASKKKKRKKKRKKRGKGKSTTLGGPADRWLSCELADKAHAFVSTGETCGSRFEIVVVDADGKQVARVSEARKGVHVRARRGGGDTLHVEVASGEATEVFVVGAKAIESLGMGTALAVSPPASCRTTCDSRFANPRAP